MNNGTIIKKDGNSGKSREDYIVRLHPYNGEIEVRNDISEDSSISNGYTILRARVSKEKGLKVKSEYEKEHVFFFVLKDLTEYTIREEYRPYGLGNGPTGPVIGYCNSKNLANEIVEELEKKEAEETNEDVSA
ncbi:MAG: hypothetical protein IJ890_03010 [Clostridia bacterium]|nr:hypothetical protein [Clostridia bacterium]